jgi:hypothetical protein
MPRLTWPAPPQLDSETLKYAVDVLTDRLRAVETYGAGGCPSCHDAELRGAIAKLRELAGTKMS